MQSFVSKLSLGIVLCACTAAYAALPAIAQQMQAKVVQVHDGDTITVVDIKQKRYRVQMDGIDAPELGQAYGESSKKHLERRIRGKSVILMWHKSGKDGALIAKVVLNNGDINLLQLRTGSAWTTKRVTVHYNNSSNDTKRYASAQEHAKAKQLGLWRNPAAIEPSEWRKQHEAK